MATTDTEKTVVLNIDAQSGIKSMKDLKQAIKDGKDQLAGLTAGTEEYNQVLAQTAELQHQYREINQEVTRSTKDFGQTLSNVNSVMAGGVAAIQGVTASLSLMGIDMGDDDKLTKKLVQSMALLQSMSKMDAAVKGFKALTVSLKAAIVSAGGLGKALKSLALSNPFTAILAGITAVIAAMSILSTKAKENAENLAAIGTSISQIQDADFQNAMNGGIEAITKFEQHAKKNFDKVYQSALNYMELTVSTIEKYKAQEHDIEEENVKWLEDLSANRRNNEAKQYEEEYKKWTEYLAKETDTTSTMYKNMQEMQREAQMKVHAVNIAFYQQESRALDAWLTVDADHLDAATRDMITQRRIALQQMITEEAKLYNNVASLPDDEQKKKDKEAEEARRKQQEAARKARQDRETKLANQYKHELSMLKQANQLALAAEERHYQEDLKLYENNAAKKEEIELEHQKRVLDINVAYMEKQIELMRSRLEQLQKMNKDGSKQGDIDSLNEQINELNRKIQDNTAEYETNTRAVERNRIERELAIKQLERETALIENQSAAEHQRWQISHNAALQDIEDTNKKLETWGVFFALWSKYGGDNRITKPFDDNIKMLTADIDNLNNVNDGIMNQLDGLRENFAAGLLAKEDYDNQVAALNAERVQNEQAIADKEVEIERNKQERKKALALQGAMAINSITTSMVSVLNSLAEAEDMSFEESKKLKIAAAIISTIQGGLVAFLTTMEAVGGGPWGIAAGAAASAAVVAAGMIEVQKIRNTKPGSSASLSDSAMSNITLAQPQIVNLNAVNDEIELPDQRVYVTEYDIRETMRRVEIVEDNSNF